MIKVIKKNQLVLLIVALMLITAGYLNYSYNQGEAVATSSKDSENFGDATLVQDTEIAEKELEKKAEEEAKETANQAAKTNDYFESAKLERDKLYSGQLETYKEMLDKTNVPNEEKAKATEEIKKVNDIKNGIMIAENLMKVKDFKDVVILVNNDSVNVIIRSDEALTEAQVAQAQNIVSRELKAAVENIHIMNK